MRCRLQLQIDPAMCVQDMRFDRTGEASFHEWPRFTPYNESDNDAPYYTLVDTPDDDDSSETGSAAGYKSGHERRQLSDDDVVTTVNLPLLGVLRTIDAHTGPFKGLAELAVQQFFARATYGTFDGIFMRRCSFVCPVCSLCLPCLFALLALFVRSVCPVCLRRCSSVHPDCPVCCRSAALPPALLTCVPIRLAPLADLWLDDSAAQIACTCIWSHPSLLMTSPTKTCVWQVGAGAAVWLPGRTAVLAGQHRAVAVSQVVRHTHPQHHQQGTGRRQATHHHVYRCAPANSASSVEILHLG